MHLWGAGQMMFNKFMLVTDDSSIIENYHELLKRISSLDFRQHLIFTKGPLDVLDHSAQNMGYGSKMGVDLTVPLPEESASYSQNPVVNAEKGAAPGIFNNKF